METKSIISQISAIASSVCDGETDAIRAYIDLKRIANRLEAAFSAIDKEVLDECDKYDPRELSERGIQVRAGVGRWNYSECAEWIAIENQRKALEKELQGRAATTRDLVDPETGELLDKPYKTFSKRTVIISKKILENF